MIKRIKSSDKTVRPFTAFKRWKYSSIDSLDTILLEQDLFNIVNKESGELLYENKNCKEVSEIISNLLSRKVNICESFILEVDNYLIEKKIRSPEVLYENGRKLSAEDKYNDTDGLVLRTRGGAKVSGTFYPTEHRKYNPTKEPVNYDGSYQRLVYNNIKHLFYNDYFVEHFDYSANKKLNIKNPLMLFGVESAEYHDPSVIEDIDQGSNYSGRRLERRVLDEKITVIEISQKNFGDKIKPNSVSILDNSSQFDTIKIKDDGYTNLITEDFTFTNIEKISHADSICDDSSIQKTENDFYFGKTTDSFERYLLVGSPVGDDSIDESQSGRVTLFKKDLKTNKFRCIRSFVCPFSQNGISLEMRQDHNDLLLKEIMGVVLANNYSLNDNFGSAIQISNNVCVIGASRSHIRGTANEKRTGSVFVYEKDKGGVDNWGMINVIEGIPDTDFGHSISVYGDRMAISAPTAMGGLGVVYIFKKTKRTKKSPWIRLTDVPEGYFYDLKENKRKGYPTGDDLKKINKYTTRWKVKSVIPDGSPLSEFGVGGEIQNPDNCISGNYLSGNLTTGVIGGEISKQIIPDRIISGSIISGNLISGCLESGSFLSGSYLSGSIISGSYLSGSFLSGSYLSGSIISGSYLSGSIISGSFISGCIESGSFMDNEEIWWEDIISGCVIETINPTKEVVSGSIESVEFNNCISGSNTSFVDKQCPNDYYTFGGDSIYVETIINDEIKDFDSGYKPHEYTDTPDFAIGDTTWELEDCVFNDSEKQSEYFGETLTLHENRLFIGTPSSEDQNVYVYEYNQQSCPSKWTILNKITRDFIWSSKTNIQEKYEPRDRSLDVLYPYEYVTPIKNKFGISIDVNDSFVVIGDSIDRGYKNDHINNEAGSVFLYNNNDNISFGYKIYSLVDSEEQSTFRFGNSISLYENYLMVGSHSTDFSNFSFDKNSNLFVDDYFTGVDTISEEFLEIDGEMKNMVQGMVHYYRLDNKSYELLKTLKSTKKRMDARRQFGYSVSFNSYFTYIGSPLLGCFPFSQLTTFDDENLNLDSSESLFCEYENMLYQTTEDSDKQSFEYGQVLITDSNTITQQEKTQIGNIFYRNGIIVLNDLGKTYMKNFMKKSGPSGYEINFKGSHTLYETEILCKVEPHEFNVSTNPSSLVREKILYDINNDGKFDILDMIYIFRFLTEKIIVDQSEIDDSESSASIAIEQDSMWPNSDILLTESEDAILRFFVNEARDIETEKYEQYRPYLNKLKSLGVFDVNNDGVSDSLDAKLILRYFKGNSGIELIKNLINKNSKRRVATDVISFLDEMTGKYNGKKVIDDFVKFRSLDRLIKHGKNMDSLKPHVTTIGLYDGLSLVGVAKLGKPVKITDSYPINFLVKYDG